MTYTGHKSETSLTHYHNVDEEASTNITKLLTHQNSSNIVRPALTGPSNVAGPLSVEEMPDGSRNVTPIIPSIFQGASFNIQGNFNYITYYKNE